MSIVLNEKEWAEIALANRQMGRKPIETLSRIARYYYQSEGYNKAAVQDKLEDFLLRCDPGVTLVKWSDTLDRIVKSADKYPLIELEGVSITQAELDTVCALEGKQQQRLAFTLLSIAKYWDAAQPKNNGWVNTPDKEVMKMANINTSVHRQSLMLHRMREAGLLQFSKRVDNLNIRVRFIAPDSPVALQVSDFRNLGNQYLLHNGEPYFRCAQCGLVIRRKSNAHRYCSDCAAEMYVKKSVESVVRHRAGLSEKYKNQTV